MRAFLIACAILLAAAPAWADDEAAKPQYLESQTDIGGVFGSGRFGHRWMTRTLLNVDDRENAFEAHYGLAWKLRERMWLDLTAGYAYRDDGPGSHHDFVVSTWKDMAFLKHRLMLKLEGQHRFTDDGYRYEGFYAVDYAVAGLHVLNRGREAAAGFQFGSGYGLLPFRVDIRISFGLTDGMADHASRFVLTFDFR